MTDKFTHPKDAKEGHKWQDSDGTPVTDLHYFEGSTGVYQIFGTIGGVVKGFSDGGTSSGGVNVLIDAPVGYEVWVNLHMNGSSTLYDTKAIADKHAANRIACQKFTITAGRFDDEK